MSNENHLERAEHPKSPSVAKRLFSQENQIENVEGTKVKLSNEDEKDVGAERMEIDEIDENFSSVMTSQSGTDSSR